MNELDILIQDFLNYMLTIQGKSKQTVRNYKYDLLNFSIYIKTNNLNIFTIITNNLYEYILSMKDLSNSSRRRKIACLKSFFKFLTNKAKILKDNPAQDLEYPQQPTRLVQYLTLNECQRLLSIINNKRDNCIVNLFLFTGIRLSELISLNLSDVKEDYIKINRSKSNKEQNIELNPVMKDILQSYIKTIRNPINTEDNALFLSRLKKRLSVRTVEVMVEKYLKQTGLYHDGINCHTLRHSFATMLHKNGVDILTLKEILGHSCVSVTQIYTHIENTELQEAINSHPLAHFKPEKNKE